MANQIYGYNSSTYNPTSYNSTPFAGSVGLSSVYPSSTSSYLSDPSLASRYLTSTDPLAPSDSSKYSSLYQTDAGYRYPGTEFGAGYSASRIPPSGAAAGISGVSQTPWSGIDVGVAGFDPNVAGIKRPNEALYHQTVLGTHNSIGQSEAAFFSTHTLAKRPRIESATSLPVYPQRPGFKDCAHYMLTRTCKFEEACKFHHPTWVPEGGVPDWKEVPLFAVSESLPERPGEPDCPYFLKHQKCKYGFKCKFNHPKDKIDSSNALEAVDVSLLPDRPSEPSCSFYLKTGKCKFGAACKFHHPKDIQIPPTGQENGNEEQTASAVTGDVKAVKPFVPVTPAMVHNSKGLPIRPGDVDCTFYLKTGSCKFGASCRFNHPELNSINPAVAAGLGHAIIPPQAVNMNMGIINPVASVLPTMDPRLATQAQLGLGTTVYPQRPGQLECDFYMKMGSCKFGERCKFHHPIDRSAPSAAVAKQVQDSSVKLTLAGFPRREGSIICPYYMKTGTCKYGATCRYDHPPPGEAIAMATVQVTSATVGEEEDKAAETNEEQ